MSENDFPIDSTGCPALYGQGPRSAESADSWVHSEATPAIKHYLEILSRRKWTILTFMAAVFALMAALTLIMPWTYKGEAAVEITPSAPNVTTFAAVTSNSSRGDEYTRTQAAILKNRGLASKVIEKLDMDKNPAFNPYLAIKERGVIYRMKDLLVKRISRLLYGELPQSMVRLKQREALIDAFEADLDVQNLPGTNVIAVSFSSTNRSLAKDASNETVEALMNWQVDRSVDAARLAKARLEKQVGAARKRLEKSQAQLDAYARQWGIVSLKSGAGLIAQKLEMINRALEKVQTNRITKSAYYHNAQNSDLASLPAVMQSTVIQQLENQYTQLMSKYEELRVIYKDDYPELEKLKARIDYTGRKIALEEKRVLNALKNDYDTSTEIEQELTAAAKKDQALALDFNNKVETYRTLQRQVDTNRQVYTSLLKRSEEVDANMGAELGNVKVLNLSPLPVMPYKPNLLLNFLIALVLGASGGVGLAFLLENSDSTLKSPGEVFLGPSTRILGVLPYVNKAAAKGLAVRVLTHPEEIFSESIRFTRTLIELSSPTGGPARSILITSTEANAGKSTVAANLALDYASCARHRVLLVDADLSLGRLHESFAKNGGKRPAGLSEYLCGHATLDEIVCDTELPNLSFIPSGMETDLASRLLQSERMKNLLTELASRFDRIIVDGQPFGSVILAMAKMVEGVIFIASIGRTHWRSPQIFLEGMSNIGANVLGAVVNRLQVNRYSFDYHSRYYRASNRKSRGGIDLIARQKASEEQNIGDGGA